MRSILFLLMMSSTASAACNTDLLTFVEWSIKPIDATNNEITAVFRSNATKPIRMIDASASYTDALGGSIGSFSLDRDVSVDPGGLYKETKTWGPYTFERLLALKPEEVTTSVCVKAVLYDDGDKEQF